MMSHIYANDEYRSQVGATKRPENIVIRYVSFVITNRDHSQFWESFTFSTSDNLDSIVNFTNIIETSSTKIREVEITTL
jgi:hypothetical protein